MKMSLQGGKKRVKRSCERAIVYIVHKLMQTVSQEGITITYSEMQKRVAETTRVGRKTSGSVLKEGENVELMW
jgi:hypothetical protein